VKRGDMAIVFVFLVGAAHAECVLGPPVESSSHVRISAVAAGKPVEGAKVFFRPTEGCICATDILRGNPLDTTAIASGFSRLTNGNGVAELPELATGYYDVGVTINDVATSIIQIRVRNKDEVSTFSLDLTEQVRRVEAVPVRDRVGAFQGTVEDPSGTAIAGARIVVVKKGSQAKDVVLTAKADGDGYFSGQLADGWYIAFFFSQGFRAGIVPLEVATGGTANLRVSLRVGGCA
jgi:hypothetical protein